MNRVMRMGIGLVTLILVLGFSGSLFEAVGIEGEAAAWMAFGTALVWILLMTWWTLRAPPQLTETEEARGKYLAFLRHAQYQPLDEGHDGSRRDRR